ncbi:DNA-binding transcriptional LysR family regulator [Xanthomonas translucens]|nr:DNA-binding transcriptional LysR family regulator [Xanthomonas translucens]
MQRRSASSNCSTWALPLRAEPPIRTYAANQRRESQGRLTLTTTHSQARFVLPPAVAQIKQAYP